MDTFSHASPSNVLPFSPDREKFFSPSSSKFPSSPLLFSSSRLSPLENFVTTLTCSSNFTRVKSIETMTDGNSSGGGNEVQTSPTRATQPPNTKNKSRHAQAAWFVGERTLKPKFVHIDDHGLLRMFTTPSNSELPHHGLTLHKYNESLTTKLQTGPDNDGLYETERGGKKRTYDEVEADALQDAKDITADDKCYLWAVVKNLMASRMSWKG